MYVLGIESSCDETGAAVFSDTAGLVAHALHSQVALHAIYGGVVPELASRDHVKRVLPLVGRVLAEAHLAPGELDAVAYTAGPGLIGALLTGAMTATALAYAAGLPTVPVHHMEGHLLAPLLEPERPDYPFVALLISGGHTLLIHVTHPGAYRLLGQSVDDALGEAFDKTAKLLGLPYPGGAGIEALAARGHPGMFHFPRPMLKSPNCDFSFAGLKTAVLLTVRARPDLPEQMKCDVARGFTEAVTATLAAKCRRALRAVGGRRLVVAGGVSANGDIRAMLTALCADEGVDLYLARPEFCTDNGAMIAAAGMMRLKAGQCGDYRVKVYPRWPLDELPPC